MAVASVSYTFAPNTLILSSEANTDFQDLVTFLNNQVVHRDASGAFTAVPSGPSSDPISDNQFTRKAYVDGAFALVQQIGFSTSTSISEQTVSGFTTVLARGVTASASGLTIVTTGTYDVGYIASFSTDVSGKRAARVTANGNSIVSSGMVSDASSDSVGGYGLGLQWERPHVSLTAGDVLNLRYTQTSGNALLANVFMWVRTSR